MPPRKSAASSIGAADISTNLEGDSTFSVNPTNGGTPTTASTSKAKAVAADDGVSIEDLLLPRTLTHRLARGVLPANTSIHRDALLALTKAATVFVSYLASTSNELTQKRTIGPQDVIAAVKETEFEGFTDRLERELEKFADVNKGKRKGYRAKVKARESGASGVEGEEDNGEAKNGERENKRVKMDGEDEDSISSPPHPWPQPSIVGGTTTGEPTPMHPPFPGSQGPITDLGPSDPQYPSIGAQPTPPSYYTTQHPTTENPHQAALQHQEDDTYDDTQQEEEEPFDADEEDRLDEELGSDEDDEEEEEEADAQLRQEMLLEEDDRTVEEEDESD